MHHAPRSGDHDVLGNVRDTTGAITVSQIANSASHAVTRFDVLVRIVQPLGL